MLRVPPGEQVAPVGLDEPGLLDAPEQVAPAVRDEPEQVVLAVLDVPERVVPVVLDVSVVPVGLDEPGLVVPPDVPEHQIALSDAPQVVRQMLLRDDHFQRVHLRDDRLRGDLIVPMPRWQALKYKATAPKSRLPGGSFFFS